MSQLWIRILRGDDPGLVGTTRELGRVRLSIGRDESCGLPLVADSTASRRHAAIELEDGDHVLRDQGSANGTWVNGHKIVEHVLQAGDVIRVGSTYFTVEGPQGEEDASRSAPGWSKIGERRTVSGNRPFLLDDPRAVWIVEEGRVEIFTVAVEGGVPRGPRTHFATVDVGEAMFGMDLESYDFGSGFLAVGRMGTTLRRVGLGELQGLARSLHWTGEVARLVDTWCGKLSKCLTAGIAAPRTDLGLSPGEVLALDAGTRIRSAKGVVWLEVTAGDLLYVGMEYLQADRSVLFPIVPESWAEVASGESAGARIETHFTASKVGERELWQGLAHFHEVLCRCEFINKRLAQIDELNRLKSKAEYAEEAGAAALEALSSVLEGTAGADRPGRADRSDLFQAVASVGGAMGIEVLDHPEAGDRETFEDQLAVLARASRFRTRVVVLRDEWWRRDHGPFLGRTEEDEHPLALIPSGPRSYDCIDPRVGRRVPVNAALAATLKPFGHSFYRPFLARDLGLLEVVRFGAKGLSRDFAMVGTMAIILGLLGTVAPYFTGQILDTAIPRAERGFLLQFCLGLVVVAVASGLFQLTQSVAMLRVQTRMDLSVQVAVWDRLLNLPPGFFRQYSAGDLADRAFGISSIRSLVAQAGIGAILGGLSSVFFVGLMAYYDAKLAGVAVVLTLVLVAVTVAANYLQLRLQRDLLEQRGKITGLVHQLVSGITKIRVAGAYQHVFRVWAERFSSQRRLAFQVGTIQNRASVFNSGYAVLSTMAIFWAMAAFQPPGAPDRLLTTGQFIAFVTAFGSFTAAMLAVSGASLSLFAAVPIYERLLPILTTDPETDETRSYPGRLKGSIEISHVHFRYEADGAWILRDLNLRIEPGEFVALVGPSGSGKSTLMRLLLGFETPEKGSIYYDDQDLGTLDVREVRQQLGVVLQESRVLPADLYRNIVGTSSRSIEDAWQAAEAAGLADDIRAMPMQMHTHVSEDGGSLSGGQRQRLLIARALVDKPRILFFDEATSALDNRTQQVVTESMDRLHATRIVIAHRLSTILHADRILYLENGVVVEEGSYEELLALDGKFADLARRQVA